MYLVGVSSRPVCVHTDRIVAIGKLIPSAHSQFSGAVGTTFLLTDSRLPDGVIFAISAHYVSQQPVRFQVWRPTNVSSTYKLVWEHPYQSPVAKGRHDVRDLSVTLQPLLQYLA